MHKGYFSLAVLLGAFSIALGAFGAHGLKQLVPPDMVAVFDTGVRYQLYHSLAILALSLGANHLKTGPLRRSVFLFVLGILLFSGSLYLITILKAMDGPSIGMAGIITPAGGLCLIAGWLNLLLAIDKRGETGPKNG